jgi:hypothetical protein
VEIDAQQMEVQPGERLQHQRAAGEIILAYLGAAGEAVNILLQLHIIRQCRHLIGEVQSQGPATRIRGVEKTVMQRGDVERQPAQLRPIPDRNLWYAEIDVELLDLDGVVVDVPAEATLLEGLGTGARDAARTDGVYGGCAIGLVNFDGEYAAQVISGDEVEEPAEAFTPEGGHIMGAGGIVIAVLARDVLLPVWENVVEEPRHLQFRGEEGGRSEPNDY